MLEVHVKSTLPKFKLDILQQNVWGFDVNWIRVGQETVGEVFIDAGGVGLYTPSGQKPLYFSWDESFLKWSRERGLKQNPLIKASGQKAGSWIIDATVGLGKDSALFLAAGLKVKGFERQQKIFFLQRAAQILEGFMEENLILHFGEISENPWRAPIYFDPMFDDGQKRKAKPTKGMALFHQVIGADKDAVEVAKRLRQLCPRLIIKRSPRDPMLLENRNSSWESKAVRFDLYL